jgi:hypothetical protein
VLFQWTYSYVTYKRGARIITSLTSEAINSTEAQPKEN